MNWNGLYQTQASGWVILIRLLVGLVVFFPEGIQKLIFPDILGAGRFANIGIPYPDLMGPFVGTVETVCGALIILGLFTRLAAIPLIIIMVVAIVSTKMILMVTDSLTVLNRKRVFEYAAAHRLPAIYEFDFLVRDGGLMSYGPDFDENFARVAALIHGIFSRRAP